MPKNCILDEKGGENQMAKSRTKNTSGLLNSIFGTKTYKTKISGGGRSKSGWGSTSQKSSKAASKKWHKR